VTYSSPLKEYVMKKTLLFLAGISCLFLSSCDIVDDIITINETAAGTVYFWISSDADTYVECVNTGGACNGSTIDHSGYDFITAGSSVLAIQRSYVNFPRPTFPPGTVIEEAYFELFHSGKNEDGKRDDILVDVHKVRTPWNAGQLTYSNQPIQTGSGGGEFHIRLESQDWSGTENIGFDIPKELGPAGNFNGFLIFMANHEPGYMKGFYSGNHKSRTLSDLGFAPRLLLKVTLPEGTTTDDVKFESLHSDGNGGGYFGYRFRQSSGWPGEWKVAHLN
jgi:hypothetical protein